ncbi:MAG: hypothetical protein ACFB6S_14550 [Geminicoccaceae bacterium]
MISEIWSFLSDPANRDTLAFLGGGLAVVVGGLWTAFAYFHKRKPPAQEKPSVSADRGGIAAGGDQTFRGSVTINNHNKLPPAAVGLAVLGLLILGFAIWNAGDRITVSNGSYVGGHMKDSEVNSK